MPRSLAICAIGRPLSTTSRTARSRSSSGYFFGAGIAELVPLPRMKSWLRGLRETRPGSGFQVAPDQLEHLPVMDPSGDPRHQGVVLNPIEKLVEIKVDAPRRVISD